MSLHALMAEFRTADELVAAARRARDEGYAELEAYAPFPVEGLAEAVGLKRNRVPLITLLGGIVGGVGGYVMQWYSAVVSYPINVGGRPLHSWPSFIPVTFELTILGAALAAVFGMLALNGLPRLSHPIFNASEFDLATRNRFFLAVGARDVRFDAQRTRDFLQALSPMQVSEVADED